MVLRSIGLIFVSFIALSACDTEAGMMQEFPTIGGRRPVILPPVSIEAELPPLTEAQANDAMTDNLSAAVNDALGLTEENIEPIPQTPAVVNMPNVPIDPNSGAEIASDSGVLNLALSSQEEQRRLREADAAALQAAAAQRIIIEPGAMPEVIAGVNVIAYARSTTNAVGEKVVRRPLIRRRNSPRECAKFTSVDDAQRNFLANGGPANDPLNLDPDGDGFACRWSPDAYRALQLN